MLSLDCPAVGALTLAPFIPCEVPGDHQPRKGLLRVAGLTKVPIDGQPKSIVRELEDMARSYIKARAPRQLPSQLRHCWSNGVSRASCC